LEWLSPSEQTFGDNCPIKKTKISKQKATHKEKNFSHSPKRCVVMSTYGHRQMMGAQQMPMAGGSARLNELLEAIRQEFEAHSQDNPMQRMQREDFEHKRMFCV
jgi:hypothetical protein